MTKTATIPRTHYAMLAELVAAEFARKVLDGNEFTHPGDPIGMVLTKAWMIDDGSVAVLAMAAYLRELQSEARRRSLRVPSFDQIMRALPNAFNDVRYPHVNFPALATVLFTQVPEHVDTSTTSRDRDRSVLHGRER